jgi:hypothetical protein
MSTSNADFRAALLYYDARHKNLCRASILGSDPLCTCGLSDLLTVETPGTGHRRSPERSYDPTPCCLLCQKDWDPDGRVKDEYACHESRSR